MENLKLGIEWAIDEQQLKAAMDQAKKNIEGVGQSVQEIEKNAHKNVSRLVQNSDSEIQRLQDKIAKLQADLQRAAAPKGSLLPPDDGSIERYKREIADLQNKIQQLQATPVIPGDMKMLPPQVEQTKRSFNGLQNSLNQISRELPAFTYSAQTGFMAVSNNIPILVDELAKLKKENEALIASGQKGVPVWKQLASSLLSWQTAMSVGITLLTVYGKEIGQFISSLFKGSQAAQEAAQKINVLNAAFNSTDYGKSIKDLAELRSAINGARDGVVSKNDALALYNASIGKTAGAIKSWSDLEQWQLDNEKKYLAFMFRKAQAQAMLQTAIDKTVEAEKRSLDGPGLLDYFKAITLTGFSSMDAGAKLQNQLGIANLRGQSASAMRLFEQFNRELQDYAKKNGFDLYQLDEGKTKKAQLSILSEHKSLMDEIKAIDQDYARNTMTDQQQEQAAFDEKFQKIREKIIAFNKNPEYKIKVSMEVVDGMQERLQGQLTYNQNTDSLVKVYRQDLEQWKQYEALKSRVSEEYARERFGTMADYYRDVESRVWQEIDGIRSGGNDLDADELKRMQALQGVLQEISEYEQEQMTELVSRLITYEQKRKNLINRFEAERIEVIKRGSDEELRAFDSRYAEELNSLDDANIQQLASYKELFNGIENLSDTAARKVIADARLMIRANKNMSAAERQKILKAITEAEQSLDERLYDRVLDISYSFEEMATTVSLVNQELGSMIGLLSNVLRATVQVGASIKDLKKGLANYQEQRQSGQGGIMGSISAIAGVVGPIGSIVAAVGGVVSGVIGLFKASKESARQAAKEIKEYQDSVIYGELEHNRLLRERAREQQNINNLTLEQLKIQQQLLNNQKSSAKEDFEDLFQRIQDEGEQITGQKTERYGGFLGIGRKTRVVNVTEGIQGYTYDELEKLYNSNKMTEETRKIFEQLRALKQEMDALDKDSEGNEEEFLNKMSGGADYSSMAGSILQAIKEGKRGWDDFADYGEDVVRNALLSAMSATVLEQPLQELVKQFREDSEDGLSAEEIKAFQQGYKAIVEKGLEAVKEIEKSIDLDLNSSDSGMSGRIQSITQDQADVLAGQVMGIHLAVVRGQELSQKVYELISSNTNDFRSALLYWQAIADYTATTASNTGRLERIEYWLEKISKGNNNTLRAGGN